MNTKQEKRQILNRQSNKFQSTTHFTNDKIPGQLYWDYSAV